MIQLPGTRNRIKNREPKQQPGSEATTKPNTTYQLPDITNQEPNPREPKHPKPTSHTNREPRTENPPSPTTLEGTRASPAKMIERELPSSRDPLRSNTPRGNARDKEWKGRRYGSKESAGWKGRRCCGPTGEMRGRREEWIKEEG